MEIYNLNEIESYRHNNVNEAKTSCLKQEDRPSGLSVLRTCKSHMRQSVIMSLYRNFIA